LRSMAGASVGLVIWNPDHLARSISTLPPGLTGI
jgi:hypothetical protein